MFFDNLIHFSEQVALIEAESGKVITYRELQQQIDDFSQKHLAKNANSLVFIECDNSIEICVALLANLQAGNVIHLVANLSDNKTENLIELYQPNLIVKKDGTVLSNSDFVHTFAPGLCILLSTSGSTGTPKFVKLSKTNIDSNAQSISEYLRLTNNDIALSHLKLHYSYGLSILTSHLAAGASVCLTEAGVLDEEFWTQVNKYKVTSFAGVPYTYESLHKQGFDFAKYPSLRYVTQAGGKLESSLVKWFANNAAETNVAFYVMYGQTEASPRISYLPPELASKYGACIGKAIPNGELYIVDENGEKITQADTPGELVYKGPNVMLGYATSPTELATDDELEVLKTGDIACFNDEHLYYIVGRTKRFIKPFGVRVNLDEVQSYVKNIAANSAVTGTDEKLHILVEGQAKDVPSNLLSMVVQEFKLPKEIILIKTAPSIPLLVSGKYDYKAILNLKANEKSFVTKVIDYIAEVLELNENNWYSVESLYKSTLNLQNIAPEKSFNDLQGDSLSFVFVSVELENMLGSSLPEEWFNESIEKLEELYAQVESASTQ